MVECLGWEVDVSVSETSRRYALMAGVKSFIQCRRNLAQFSRTFQSGAPWTFGPRISSNRSVANAKEKCTGNKWVAIVGLEFRAKHVERCACAI